MVLIGGFVLAACSSHSPRNIADQNNWHYSYQTQTAFEHLLIENTAQGKYLHVYIEGDGRSFISPRRVSLDPTPAVSLMLELMALDTAPSLFLGRPCYFGTNDERCNAQWWVGKRYADQVVRSMNAMLDSRAEAYEGVMLFGHSGGGTLAMLMAARREDVVALVTLAGNLNSRAWTLHHDYSALTGSLNPMDDPLLSPTIAQWHYLGEEDKNITQTMLRPAVLRQHNAPLIMLADTGHRCCWLPQWSKILSNLAR